mgnify:CR=1 FL=1
MKTTRRGLLAVLPTLALAQQAAPQKPTREQDLDNARTGIRANSEALSKFKLPQSTEPSFIFKAG